MAGEEGLASADPGASTAGPKLLPDGSGIHIGGWCIRACKAPIIGEGKIEEYTRELGNVLTVPEMLFGDSSVDLTHEASGWSISFNALDALRGWRAENLPSLKVKVAQAWQEARREEISRQEALVLEYDWTYTTPYQGTLAHAGAAGACDGGGAAAAAAAAAGPSGQQGAAQAQAQVQEKQPQQAPHSEASGTSSGGASSACQPQQQPPPNHQPSSSSSTAPPPLPLWAPTSEQLDRSLLMARDPILFYCDVPLYESELDDNGVAALGVRLRVMPRCWFALLRFWLRVDGCLVRLRETRLMCRWEAAAAAAAAAIAIAAIAIAFAAACAMVCCVLAAPQQCCIRQ